MTGRKEALKTLQELMLKVETGEMTMDKMRQRALLMVLQELLQEPKMEGTK